MKVPMFRSEVPFPSRRAFLREMGRVVRESPPLAPRSAGGATQAFCLDPKGRDILASPEEVEAQRCADCKKLSMLAARRAIDEGAKRVDLCMTVSESPEEHVFVRIDGVRRDPAVESGMPPRQIKEFVAVTIWPPEEGSPEEIAAEGAPMEGYEYGAEHTASGPLKAVEQARAMYYIALGAVIKLLDCNDGSKSIGQFWSFDAAAQAANAHLASHGYGACVAWWAAGVTTSGKWKGQPYSIHMFTQKNTAVGQAKALSGSGAEHTAGGPPKKVALYVDEAGLFQLKATADNEAAAKGWTKEFLAQATSAGLKHVVRAYLFSPLPALPFQSTEIGAPIVQGGFTWMWDRNNHNARTTGPSFKSSRTATGPDDGEEHEAETPKNLVFEYFEGLEEFEFAPAEHTAGGDGDLFDAKPGSAGYVYQPGSLHFGGAGAKQGAINFGSAGVRLDRSTAVPSKVSTTFAIPQSKVISTPGKKTALYLEESGQGVLVGVFTDLNEVSYLTTNYLANRTAENIAAYVVAFSFDPKKIQPPAKFPWSKRPPDQNGWRFYAEASNTSGAVSPPEPGYVGTGPINFALAPPGSIPFPAAPAPAYGPAMAPDPNSSVSPDLAAWIGQAAYEGTISANQAIAAQETSMNYSASNFASGPINFGLAGGLPAGKAIALYGKRGSAVSTIHPALLGSYWSLSAAQQVVDKYLENATSQGVSAEVWRYVFDPNKWSPTPTTPMQVQPATPTGVRPGVYQNPLAGGYVPAPSPFTYVGKQDNSAMINAGPGYGASNSAGGSGNADPTTGSHMFYDNNSVQRWGTLAAGQSVNAADSMTWPVGTRTRDDATGEIFKIAVLEDETTLATWVPVGTRPEAIDSGLRRTVRTPTASTGNASRRRRAPQRALTPN